MSFALLYFIQKKKHSQSQGQKERLNVPTLEINGSMESIARSQTPDTDEDAVEDHGDGDAKEQNTAAVATATVVTVK